jgi:pantoate--beta-alanine ligase
MTGPSRPGPVPGGPYGPGPAVPGPGGSYGPGGPGPAPYGPGPGPGGPGPAPYGPGPGGPGPAPYGPGPGGSYGPGPGAPGPGGPGGPGAPYPPRPPVRIPWIARTRAELRAALANAPRPIGFVPTMGALHAGHASLIARARAENPAVVISIFVNPTQFNERADFDKYPRTEAADLALAGAVGADVAFIPSVEEIYPAGSQTSVHVGGLTEPLEGAARPGHFDGVTTVVAILLSLVRADRAYFGQKDAQQLLVVRRMALDLGIGTDIVGCPIVREPDGLALSSRNTLLTPEQRAAAPVLRRALLAARGLWEGGERNGESLRAAMLGTLLKEPLATVDYVSCADPSTLQELAAISGPALLSMAVRFGSVRLIDNEPLA